MAGSVMLTVRASDADSLVARLFRKSGALPSHANVVARHLVATFGGIDGRLATNPIAFAIPNGPTPVVADFSTSAMPEGKLRVARNVGGRLPPGVLQDPFGNATDDPGVLYGKPRGTLLPLGGPTFGHKGY